MKVVNYYYLCIYLFVCCVLMCVYVCVCLGGGVREGEVSARGVAADRRQPTDSGR
jgi:hypothetical protein